MKYAVFMAVILSIFYISATQLVLNEINNLSYIYKNADAIAQSGLYGDD